VGKKMWYEMADPMDPTNGLEPDSDQLWLRGTGAEIVIRQTTEKRALDIVEAVRKRYSKPSPTAKSKAQHAALANSEVYAAQVDEANRLYKESFVGKKIWFDWEQALAPFHENLLKIGAHLRKHSAIENAELYAAQVDEADRLFKEWRETDVSLPWGRTLEKLEEKREQAWWAYWTYVGEHLQDWWD